MFFLTVFDSFPIAEILKLTIKIYTLPVENLWIPC